MKYQSLTVTITCLALLQMLNYTVGIECYRCGSATDTRCEAPLNTMTGIIQNNWWPENKTADLSSTRYVVCLTLVQRSVGPGQEFLQVEREAYIQSQFESIGESDCTKLAAKNLMPEWSSNYSETIVLCCTRNLCNNLSLPINVPALDAVSTQEVVEKGEKPIKCYHCTNPFRCAKLPADKDKGTKPNYGIAGSCTTLVTVFKTTGEVVYAQRFHTNPATVLHKLKKMPEKCDNVTEYDGEYNALQGRYVQPGDKPETITRVFCCKGQDYCNSQEFDLVWDRKTTAVSTSTPPKKSVTQAGSYLTSSSTIVVFVSVLSYYISKF